MFQVNLPQAKYAVAVTTGKEDAVILKILVMKERVTAMALLMEDNMTAILDVKEAWSVEATIANSLEPIIIRRMTAAKDQKAFQDTGLKR